MPTYVRTGGAWVEVGSSSPTITVNQTGYSGANPITVANTDISIASNSNAYGTRYIQTYTPTTEGNNGDVWYQIT